MKTIILIFLSPFILDNMVKASAPYPEDWMSNSDQNEVSELTLESLRFYFPLITANQNSLILQFSRTAAPFLISEDPFDENNQKFRHSLPGETVAFPVGRVICLNHRINGITFEPLPSPFERRGFFVEERREPPSPHKIIFNRGILLILRSVTNPGFYNVQLIKPDFEYAKHNSSRLTVTSMIQWRWL